MSQEYVHACERAELLGLPKPSEEEWKESQRTEVVNCVNENDDNEVIQNLDTSDEAARRMHGGLDELNTILSSTQKKLNRFKTVCGSLTGLLKIKVGSRHGTPTHKPEVTNDVQDVQETEENLSVELSDTKEPRNPEGNPQVTPRNLDISQKMSSHLGKLDSLVAKAENAQYSMQHQNKQMRRMLK